MSTSKRPPSELPASGPARPTRTQRQHQQNRSVLIVGTLVAALLVVALLFTLRPGTAPSLSGTRTFDLQGAPTLGQASAPVQLVVFEDFKCPNCKRFEEQELPVLQRKYLDAGRARLSWLPFPFIAQQNNLPTDDSLLAAEAGYCAADQRPALFWAYAPVIFRAQGSEAQVWASADRLTELAGYVDGLDPARLRACLDSGAATKRVQAGYDQGRRLGVNATPSVFVNGVLVSDYSATTVGAAIDQALK
jgi:protein-disulfide isomerase